MISFNNERTNIEKFSLTEMTVNNYTQWENAQSSKSKLKIFTKGLVAISVPLISLIDAFAHSVIFTGKLIASIVLFPYTITVLCSKGRPIPQDLSPTSPLIHLMAIFMALAKAVTLNFLFRSPVKSTSGPKNSQDNFLREVTPNPNHSASLLQKVHEVEATAPSITPPEQIEEFNSRIKKLHTAYQQFNKIHDSSISQEQYEDLFEFLKKVQETANSFLEAKPAFEIYLNQLQSGLKIHSTEELDKLKRVLSMEVGQYQEAHSILQEITDGIHCAIVETVCVSDETIRKIHETLYELMLDIELFRIENVRHSVIRDSFRHLYKTIRSFNEIARKQRKLMMISFSANKIALLYEQQKQFLKKHNAVWKSIHPHIKELMQTLESKSELPDSLDIEYDREQAMWERERSKRAHYMWKNDSKDFYNVVGYVRDEANRTYDALMRGGYIGQSMWNIVGNVDNEITGLY